MKYILAFLLASILFAIGTSIWIYNGGAHHHDTLQHNGQLYEMVDVVQDFQSSLKRDGEEKIVCYRESHRNFYIFIFQLSLVIVGLASYGAYTKIRLSRRLTQQNGELAESREVLDKTNQAMLAGIRYARRMQQAMLPNPERLERSVKQSMLLYRPKDHVSGDFYWITEVEGRKIFIVADSTGHGVPGGFLATLGLTSVRTVVDSELIWEPAEILARVNARLYQTLSYEEGHTESDGIEMTVITVDPAAGTALFAGAKGCALWVAQGQEVELKGDRITLGHRAEASFTSHSIKFQAGDWFFQFTDGFADQFGGPEGKKFSKKRLRSLLTSLTQDADPVQLELAFMDWCGNRTQVDDVLVMGYQA